MSNRLHDIHSKIKRALDDSLDAMLEGNKDKWLTAVDDMYDGLRELKNVEYGLRAEK